MRLKVNLAALLAVCWTVAAFAAPIGSNDVARAMGNWRHRHGTLGAKMGQAVKDVRKVTNGEKAVYIVRFEGGGHLIAPTDTNIRPVIMFSDGDDFDPDPNNPAWDLIGGNPKPVKAAAPDSGDDSDAETDESPSAAKNRAEWAKLLDDDNDNAPDFSEYNVDEVRVAPLTTTKWSQTVSRDGHWYGTKPCFNYYTPSNYPCGCVATATAQILRKFAYMGPNAYEGKYVNPNTKINGVKTEMTTIGAPYDWANMRDVPDDENDTELEAVGRLTGDVGIMVGMNYTPDGSGSKTYMAKLVFEKFFGYSSAMAMRGTDKAYTGHDDIFERLFVSNFDAKLPVQIALSGHSILGDGYGYTGGTIYYHLNFGWGWGGYWYNTPADLIKEGDHYTGFVGAVYNIYTNQAPNLVIASGRVTDKLTGDPVGNQRVAAFAAESPDAEVASAVTDEKGIYALYVPPGDYVVTARQVSERSEYFGSTTASPSECNTAYTKPGEAINHYYWMGDMEVGNVINRDIAMETISYEPAAEVTVGEVTVGTDFACATIPVTAKVVHYGQTATRAKVLVTLTPVLGGAAKTWESEELNDFAEHGFSASFEGLETGVAYRVEARVVMVGTGEEAGLDNGSVAAAREFTWFDESAASFSAAKWTGAGATVKVVDGHLSIDNAKDGTTTFTPESKDVCATRVVIKVRECGYYAADNVPSPDGPAAIATIDGVGDLMELVVWGDGIWNKTGIEFTEKTVNVDVVIDLDFHGHVIRYSVDGRTVGTYSIPNAVNTVSSIAFKGHAALSELAGTAWDDNLVKDANGTEYANVSAAKTARAVEPLEPLWKSTWPVGDVSGSFEAKDPNGLLVPANGMTVVKRVEKGNGVFENWYAKLGTGDTPADAAKYIQTTVDLGLANAITDNSVVKIDGFAVADGSMTFKVMVGQEAVVRDAIMSKVEVCETLGAGWRNPDADEIVFDETKHEITVTPKSKADPTQKPEKTFVRVRIPTDT